MVRALDEGPELARGSVAKARAPVPADVEERAELALRAGETAASLGKSDVAISWFEKAITYLRNPDASTRATASLALAAALVKRNGASDRVCVLLTEIESLLSPDDPRRLTELKALAIQCVP